MKGAILEINCKEDLLMEFQSKALIKAWIMALKCEQVHGAVGIWKKKELLILAFTEPEGAAGPHDRSNSMRFPNTRGERHYFLLNVVEWGKASGDSLSDGLLWQNQL